MIEDLFDHECKIFHVQTTSSSPGYGLPTGSDVKYGYGSTPDIAKVSCHFGVKNSNITIVQGEPQNDMDARIKLTLPIGTDVRLNDKIVSLETGLEYTAEQPRNIRDHHIIVYIKRMEKQKPL